LCCPIRYDPKLLAAIPQEVIERDYGCGDPSGFVRPGDTVLDLGSGAGKICFIAAQLVGPKGKVIGVDFNDDMLALARRHQPAVARAVGYDNVRFLKGRIQDLATPADEVDAYLRANPVRSASGLAHFEDYCARISADSPLIASDSVDIILSNCVLNLVRQQDKRKLFGEMFRVLKRGGRVAVSDIVCDEDVPADMQENPDLWSGCISGAFREDLFLRAFEDAGFYGIQIESYASTPWQSIAGIEFRSVTVTARKGKQGPCWERNQAVMYLGPWKKVEDDDGHVLLRGQRMAVCDKTYHLLQSEPYAAQVQAIAPLRDVPLSKAKPFACGQTALRHPRQTKGARYRRTTSAPAAGACCGPEGCC
jgi:SAM-dependent methyltransferase